MTKKLHEDGFGCLSMLTISLICGIGAGLLLIASAGCAAGKAVDTTRAVEAAFRGESHVTYTVVPGSLAGMPENTIAIPTVPGKDVVFRSYYPDGTPQWSLDTRRSDVLDVLFAAAAGIDAEKFAEDARMRAWVTAEREAWMGVMQPFIQAAVPYVQGRFSQDLTNRATPQPSQADQLRAILRALRDEGLLPTTQPSP